MATQLPSPDPEGSPDLHQPPARRLQVYAFDPSADLDLETMSINRSLVRVPWEPLDEGPVGDYVEVVDVDPASGCVYQPVDLTDQHLMAQDGLPPSEGNPQFHQQMVYAVAMLTIDNFERALGRTIQWSERRKDERGAWLKPRYAFVKRLRIYPHALREANAYYSPDKKALLFGYFNARNSDPREGLPGGMVFSCLSHDIVAHEMTHAILDGIHRRMLEPTNPDVLAFHEAFADIVAILQHFTLPGVLEHQIARTRGELDTENLLAKLAIQFGRATGRGDALRDAMGALNERTGEWERQRPDPQRLGRTHEPHARGAMLVAAIFDAFLTVYQHHIVDLRRIATGGTGVLPEGDLHPDLVNRFANEARKAAQRILTICIRALDYLPPVDVTFGDYVRALITGDIDMVPDDERNYRVALIGALRDWGIYARDVRTLAIESLVWHPPSSEEQALLRRLLPDLDFVRTVVSAHDYAQSVETYLSQGTRESGSRAISNRLVNAYGSMGHEDRKTLRHQDSRRAQFIRERQFAAFWHDVVKAKVLEAKFKPSDYKRLEWITGLDLQDQRLRFAVDAVRPIYRTRPNGRTKPELLVSMSQGKAHPLDAGSKTLSEGDLGFKFQGGCTLLIDPESGLVRYSISKSVNSQTRKSRQRDFYAERLRLEGENAEALYGLWRKGEADTPKELFASLHRNTPTEDWS